MNTYTFTVKDDLFPQTFEGEVQAGSPEEAKEIILDDYMYILDTEREALTVTIKLIIN